LLSLPANSVRLRSVPAFLAGNRNFLLKNSHALPLLFRDCQPLRALHCSGAASASGLLPTAFMGDLLMTRIAPTLSKALAAVTLVTLLTACGGGSSGASAGGGPAGNTEPPVVVTPVIEGIATPSSVSVVTATNAS
jgi:hypothetical protein